MLPETLTALAILIANKGPIDVSSIEAQLSPGDSAEVQALVKSNSDLPEIMENLLKDTDNQIKGGQLENMSPEHESPTFGGA